ncbi:DUF3455 domain-containing protein [Achromobacter mucicolens]|uniref:DUF3455 domain-containing protein n=1 Tax=Achromobacter mucicolens TaxID=1389922 RepID=UPI00244BC803|nr:DUF3455 domain-containing protein [Achromobacter mucicolens]MDH0092469.1 DUF3455 domain-containing protein [Achromobacter mucicolens]
MTTRPTPATGLFTVALLAASAMLQAPAMAASQDALPAAVQVPAGHKVAWETVGTGEITYECRAKADAKDQMEWVFAGPKAVLKDRQGKQVGIYYGPPATWEATDGSKLTGTQVAVAPAGAGNLPYQLVKANPAMGAGAMTGVAYIQRTALKGGVAPQKPCTQAGQRSQVSYQADYIFWKAN